MGKNSGNSHSSYDKFCIRELKLQDNSTITTWQRRYNLSNYEEDIQLSHEERVEHARNFGIYSQIRDSLGIPIGGLIQSNSFTFSDSPCPFSILLPGGKVAVVFPARSHVNEIVSDIYLHIINTGNISDISKEFLISTESSINDEKAHKSYPTISTLGSGKLFAAWQAPDADGEGIFGKFLYQNGSNPCKEVGINKFSTGAQVRPKAVSLKDGVIVTWDSLGQVHGQAFDEQGARRGNEFEIDTYNRYEAFGSRASLLNYHDQTVSDFEGNDLLRVKLANDYLIWDQGNYIVASEDTHFRNLIENNFNSTEANAITPSHNGYTLPQSLLDVLVGAGLACGVILAAVGLYKCIKAALRHCDSTIPPHEAMNIDESIKTLTIDVIEDDENVETLHTIPLGDQTDYMTADDM